MWPSVYNDMEGSLRVKECLISPSLCQPEKFWEKFRDFFPPETMFFLRAVIRTRISLPSSFASTGIYGAMNIQDVIHGNFLENTPARSRKEVFFCTSARVQKETL